jgi:hypothetical protein
MNSGSHYAKEIGTNMTSLAELLVGLSDHIFTCQFRKLPSVDAAQEQLEKFKFADLKDARKVAKLSEDIIQGETCTITGHLVKAEN